MLKAAVIALAMAIPAAAQAADNCPQIQDYSCVTTVHMQRGTDTIVYRGVLNQRHSAYSYRFKARAGQVLTWHLNGPATREVIGYPSGDADGPGIPERIELKESGLYTFTVSANTMSEGAYGRFTLRLTIK